MEYTVANLDCLNETRAHQKKKKIRFLRIKKASEKITN